MRFSHKRGAIITCIKAAFATALLVGSGLAARGEVIEVPQDFCRIADALAASSPGDEVVVSPGIYYENLVLPAHDVVLRSTDPQDPHVVLTTIIDGTSSGPVIKLHGESTRATVVEGLTISHGRFSLGGGISGNDIAGPRSQAVVRRNVIRNNVAPYFDVLVGGLGAGAYLHRAVAVENVFMSNLSEPEINCDYWEQDRRCYENSGYGGGLYTSGDVTRNIFVGNRTPPDGASSGLYFFEGTVENNVFYGETGAAGGGRAGSVFRNNLITKGRDAINGVGGLVEANEISVNSGYGIKSYSARVIGNFIYDNGNKAYFSEGTFFQEERILEDNIVARNGAGVYEGGGTVSGNWFIENRGFNVRKSLSVFNNVVYSPDAVAFSEISDILCFNTVLGARTAVRSSTSALIAGNIFWGGIGTPPVSDDTHVLQYNLLQDHDHGDPTNIVADPQFLDSEHLDFRLAPGSPAIDAGRAIAGIDLDITGGTRPVDGAVDPRGDGSDHDMGAFEFGSDSDLGLTPEVVWQAVSTGVPPPGVGLLDPPDWPDWVWKPGTPMPEGVGAPYLDHDSDLDGDRIISDAELARVYSLYESATYGCDPGSVDGFAPGLPADDCCPFHSMDFSPPDHSVSQKELMRVLQLHNARRPMRLCGDGADNYCADEGCADGPCPAPGRIAHYASHESVAHNIWRVSHRINMQVAPQIVGTVVDLPAGWQIVGFEGDHAPDVYFHRNNTGELTWYRNTLAQFAYTFLIAGPRALSGTQQITINLLYRNESEWGESSLRARMTFAGNGVLFASCESPAHFAQLPLGLPGRGLGSDAALHAEVLDDFDGLTAPVTDVRWWGSESASATCSRAVNKFVVRFYVKGDAGAPGTEVYSETVTPLRRVAVENGGSQILQYSVALSHPLPLAAGWISIQGVYSDACRFYWAEAHTPQPNAIERSIGNPDAQVPMDLAFCLMSRGSSPDPSHFTHTSDRNGDGRIELGELLRVIQFYNAAEYHCDAENLEDGFDIGRGNQVCEPHAADFAQPHFVLSLSEVLRVIQIYNGGLYYACPSAGTDDGYCTDL